ncbi:MAG: invasion associated locus B family protein [Methylocapsa sp.]|nr:invasion associated locus B family protein [Methylocapsa sp.]
MRATRNRARSVSWSEFSPQKSVNFCGIRSRQHIWLLFALLLFLASGQGAHCQGVIKARYGDWELRCETPPGAAKEQCALVQRVADETKPNIDLMVIVLKTADGKNRLLKAIAPLGVFLPHGLGLKIDDVDVGRAGFAQCTPNGCVAQVVMQDKLVEQMKNGKKAMFFIFQSPEEGIGIPLSLAGFKDGFDALP